MKKILVVVLLLLFSGCAKSDEFSLSTNLDNLLDNVDSIADYRINNALTYYSYYLPSDMSEEEALSDNIVLHYNDSKIVMNLNVSAIVNAKYYNDNNLKDDGFLSDEYKVYEKSGTYSVDSINKQFIFKLYNQEDEYIMHLETSDLNFYGNVSDGDIEEVCKHLFMICKSVEVDEDGILAAYTSKDVIDYTKKQINLFDSTMPSSGQLDDLLVDGAVVGDQSKEDGSSIEDNPNDTSQENSND